MERPRLTPARAAAVLLGLLLALLAPFPAHAQSGVPGDELYIRLVGLPAGAIVEGAQLHGCADAACQSPVLLLARGACHGSNCLPGPAAYGAGLYPANDSVRSLSLSLPDDMLAGSPLQTHPLRRIVVQTDNAAYASEPFAASHRAYYLAELTAGRIELQRYDSFPPRLASGEGPVLALLLFLLAALALKPVVAALAARVLGLPAPYAVASMALPAALISAPLAWGFFPAFSPFATAADLRTAWLSLAFAASFGLGAWLLVRLGRGPGGVGGLVVAAAPAGFVWLSGAEQRLNAIDLPRLPWLSTNPWLNLALIVLAVALVESLLLHALLRRRLSLRQCAIVSLAANLAVVAVGVAGGLVTRV